MLTRWWRRWWWLIISLSVSGLGWLALLAISIYLGRLQISPPGKFRGLYLLDAKNNLWALDLDARGLRKFMVMSGGAHRLLRISSDGQLVFTWSSDPDSSRIDSSQIDVYDLETHCWINCLSEFSLDFHQWLPGTHQIVATRERTSDPLDIYELVAISPYTERERLIWRTKVHWSENFELVDMASEERFLVARFNFSILRELLLYQNGNFSTVRYDIFLTDYRPLRTIKLSPDGQKIACWLAEKESIWIGDSRGHQIAKVSLLPKGREVVDMVDLTWSPDGRQIACLVNEPRNDRIVIFSWAGKRLRSLKFKQFDIVGVAWAR